MQMLEQCAQCIEYAFEYLLVSSISLEEKSIAFRLRRLFMIGKLKLQYCAILSQIHRHKDALAQAKEGVKICHQIINDTYQLCLLYVRREKIKNTYKNSSKADESKGPEALDVYESKGESKRLGSQGRNKSFSSFLSMQDAYSGFESFSLNN
jgi:hypothetical protein